MKENLRLGHCKMKEHEKRKRETSSFCSICSECLSYVYKLKKEKLVVDHSILRMHEEKND